MSERYITEYQCNSCGEKEQVESNLHDDGYGSSARGRSDQKRLFGWVKVYLRLLDDRADTESGGFDGIGCLCPECASKANLNTFPTRHG